MTIESIGVESLWSKKQVPLAWLLLMVAMLAIAGILAFTAGLTGNYVVATAGATAAMGGALAAMWPMAEANNQ